MKKFYYKAFRTSRILSTLLVTFLSVSGLFAENRHEHLNIMFPAESFKNVAAAVTENRMLGNFLISNGGNNWSDKEYAKVTLLMIGLQGIGKQFNGLNDNAFPSNWQKNDIEMVKNTVMGIAKAGEVANCNRVEDLLHDKNLQFKFKYGQITAGLRKMDAQYFYVGSLLKLSKASIACGNKNLNRGMYLALSGIRNEIIGAFSLQDFNKLVDAYLESEDATNLASLVVSVPSSFWFEVHTQNVHPKVQAVYNKLGIQKLDLLKKKLERFIFSKLNTDKDGSRVKFLMSIPRSYIRRVAPEDIKSTVISLTYRDFLDEAILGDLNRNNYYGQLGLNLPMNDRKIGMVLDGFDLTSSITETSHDFEGERNLMVDFFTKTVETVNLFDNLSIFRVHTFERTDRSILITALPNYIKLLKPGKTFIIGHTAHIPQNILGVLLGIGDGVRLELNFNYMSNSMLLDNDEYQPRTVIKLLKDFLIKRKFKNTCVSVGSDGRGILPWSAYTEQIAKIRELDQEFVDKFLKASCKYSG